MGSTGASLGDKVQTEPSDVLDQLHCNISSLNIFSLIYILHTIFGQRSL